MDNLIADKSSAEFVVVMPFGHAVPHGSPADLQRTNTEKFEAYLLHDVIPLVEEKYRVLTDASDRAIVGLSMGGGQAITIGLQNLDKFSTIGSFSGAVPAEGTTKIGEILSDAQRVNQAVDLFWIGCGRDDFLFQRNLAFTQMLDEKGVQHIAHWTDGVHNYRVWREYLAELAPKLFHDSLP